MVLVEEVRQEGGVAVVREAFQGVLGLGEGEGKGGVQAPGLGEIEQDGVYR